MRAAIFFALLVLAVEARAMAPRDTADVAQPGAWSVGLVAPLRLGLAEGMELQTNPLTTLVAPNALVRISHLQSGGFRMAGEYGLSVPTFGMQLLQGYLFPSWERSEQQIGWMLVPRAGVVGTWGWVHAFTMRIDGAVGLPLGENDAGSTDAIAPVELLFAPALTGYRFRTGALYDVELLPWLRGRIGADVWLIGPPSVGERSPWIYSAEAGVHVGLGEAWRLAVGAAWFNSDQHATELVQDEDGFAERVRVRSNDFLPTFDVIWTPAF